MKNCYRCNTKKDLDAFGTDSARGDGKNPLCKQCVREVSAEYRNRNPEKRKQAVDAYRLANLEKCRAAQQRWYASDRDRANAIKREWVAKNKSASHAIKAKWRYEHKSAMATAKNRRASTPGHHSGAQLDALYQKQKGKCACCKSALGSKYHKDHIFPIAGGGTNDIGNIQLLCIPCNLSKGAKDPIQFMQQRGFLL